jgi:cytochrome c oxidase assembly protein subunit 15
MKSTYHPGVHRLAVFVFCWTILLLVAGALVTSNEAALSVPDWPTSYGTFTPPMVGGIIYEHSHRLIAGALGILLIIEAVVIWKYEWRRWLRWFALAAVGGVVAQAILGGEVVIHLLHYWLPVLHACFAQIMFGAILSLGVFTSKWWTLEHQRGGDISAGFPRRGIPASGYAHLAAHRWRVSGAGRNDLDRGGAAAAF